MDIQVPLFKYQPLQSKLKRLTDGSPRRRPGNNLSKPLDVIDDPKLRLNIEDYNEPVGWNNRDLTFTEDEQVDIWRYFGKV